MKSLDTEAHLDKNLEYDLLLKHLIALPHALDTMRKVTTVGVLHHEAETLRCFVNEGSLVRDDIRVLHASKVPDLCKSVILLTLACRFV